MLLISIKKIKKSYGVKEVLKNVNMDLRKGKTIGLVGMNGSGKTTLANILTGNETYDSGHIKRYNQDIQIGYLRQSVYYNYEYFTNATAEVDYGDFFEMSSMLGLKDVKRWSQDRFNYLSGGEKTKLLLTKIWSENPDLLILDEPTNHLDYVGIDWLIDSLNQYQGTCLIISHDRYFLDQVADEIAELEEGELSLYNGNYSYYRIQKQKEYEEALHKYEEQKKKERHIEHEINRLKRWSHVAHRDSTKKEGMKEYWRKKAKKKDVQIKSSIKRLEKMREEGVHKPKEEMDVEFDFEADSKQGRRVLLASNLCKQFDEVSLFESSDFSVSRSEKMGIIGINGCGKSTLINMILGNEKQTSGKLEVSSSCKIAYLSQDVLDLDAKKSVSDFIIDYSKEEQTRIRTLLSNIGITRTMVNKPLCTFSLGERTRVKLAFIISQNYDVLILDEPTNHLDLHSREQLEHTLSEYKGTLLIASHDRYLLEKITDKLLVFKDGKIKRIEMGLKEYNDRLENKTESNERESELMVINNRISYLLGELSNYSSSDVRYHELDQEFQKLIRKRNLLKN
ncbi:ribosomal protection-like ABC-F family protein [Haloplasma contractile]|uniref:Zinc transport system ATP-binding protein n=1 Tax=Haloplasma contractile SSD-17B TaxID=1033810 RepID=F7Q0I0_9MOLU|nr:ABC-F family ATP-binding cassette domain-containing protein [Haloplasma contractile]ERJ12674.1 zinc transport system ATP-binding protein [Haloplasma contractile SSD-17B]